MCGVGFFTSTDALQAVIGKLEDPLDQRTTVDKTVGQRALNSEHMPEWGSTLSSRNLCLIPFEA